MTALVCVICASPEWCACSPGTEAEAHVQGNLCVLFPAPAVPLVAYCLAHWPTAHKRDAAVQT